MLLKWISSLQLEQRKNWNKAGKSHFFYYSHEHGTIKKFCQKWDSNPRPQRGPECSEETPMISR